MERLEYSLVIRAQALFVWLIKVAKQPSTSTFVILPKPWIVERNFAWLNAFRHLSKEHEILPSPFERWIQIAFAHPLLQRRYRVLPTTAS